MCGFRSGPQDNWVITQFINKTMRERDVYVRVKYAINSQCSGQCVTTLDMYVLETNETDQNNVRDVTVFGSTPIAALTDIIRDGTTLITRVIRLEADISTPGLYVAFRDLSTCIGLSEVSVFYPICDAISFDFGANFSEIGFPGDPGVPGDTVTGTCFTNMATSKNPLDNSVTATCTVSHSQSELDIEWISPSPCMCLPGYEFIDGDDPFTQCQGVCV